MNKCVLESLLNEGGKLGFYYENLVTGDVLCHGEDVPLMAASVIKLPVLVHAMERIEAGALSYNMRFTLSQEDKLPSCGALNFLHDGLEVTLRDLLFLMITLSDNTATNMLIKLLGIDGINASMSALGLRKSKLNRLLFDSEASKRGLENYVSARDMGLVLKRIYNSTLVSGAASRDMLDILLEQRLNSKLPLPLPRGTRVAHKTGEDSGITNDVGIVYANTPYIICVLANEVNAPSFERAMHTVSLNVFNECDRK